MRQPEQPRDEVTRYLRQITPKETVERLTEGMTWVGDLDGFTLLVTANAPDPFKFGVALRHSCIWDVTLPCDDHGRIDLADALNVAREHRAECRHG